MKARPGTAGTPSASAGAELECPGLPRGADDEPVFHAPWQAQAFALCVQLRRGGLFTWPEWAQTLSRHLAHDLSPSSADPAQSAAAYYQHWLSALEELVQAKGAGTSVELQRYAQAWDQAAHRTPHGQPIELQAQDFGT